MTPDPVLTSPPSGVRPIPKVLVATTAMLSFISFWRAAAIVLNDMGSSAFYAGAIAEEAFGKSAPWFILAIMLFAYAVRALYMESCSMFVRGGVYRVVKEAMGSRLAKVSVSALMFDFILTGPISGVSAGQYLTGFLNDLFRYAHLSIVLPENLTAGLFAIVVTLYFWWENVKGIPESSGKALRIMYVTTVMVVLMLAWCGYTLWVRGAHLPPWPEPAQPALLRSGARLAAPHQLAVHHRPGRHFHRIGAFGAGHERRGDSGPGLPRARASQDPEPEKSRLHHFRLQPGVHRGRLLLRRDDHSGCDAGINISEI